MTEDFQEKEVFVTFCLKFFLVQNNNLVTVWHIYLYFGLKAANNEVDPKLGLDVCEMIASVA
jgi:hypothetical protein